MRRLAVIPSWEGTVTSLKGWVSLCYARLLFCAIAVVFLSCCKHIPQQDTSTSCQLTQEGQTQRSVPTIVVPMFTNESHQYGLEEMFTDLLIKEIVYDGRINVVGANSRSPLRINGRVISYERSPVSYGEHNIDKYRLSMQIEIIILDCSSKVIWKKVFEDFYDFISVSSSLAAKGFSSKEEDEAALELCQRICSQAVAEIQGL